MRKKKIKFLSLGACKIQKIPNNGWIEYDDESNDKVLYSTYVNEYSRVIYKCVDNHVIDGPEFNFCFNGNWTNVISDCVPRCDSKLIIGISIEPVSCTLDDVEVSCTDPAKPGTIARLACRNRYKRAEGSKQQILHCSDNGVWSPIPQQCNAHFKICSKTNNSNISFKVFQFVAKNFPMVSRMWSVDSLVI